MPKGKQTINNVTIMVMIMIQNQWQSITVIILEEQIHLRN